MDVTFALSQYSDAIIVLSNVTLYYKQQWMQADRIVLDTQCADAQLLPFNSLLVYQVGLGTL